MKALEGLGKGDAADFKRDGFVLARGMFDSEETGFLRDAAKTDRELDARSFGRGDGEGGSVRLSVWNHPGDGLYGRFARCRRIVDSMELLLGGEVYHYHSKMILKDAKVGGAWAWHQDYGYWYHNSALFPMMASALIAVDKASRENGCLQVLKGSHLLGRVDHVLTGQQAGADPERVREAEKRLELVYCQMEPGDVLFFHCNTLHRSDQNHSENPRWAMICTYNAAANDPYAESQHPRYTRLEKAEDSAIREAGRERFMGHAGEVAWLDPATERTAAKLKGEGHGPGAADPGKP